MNWITWKVMEVFLICINFDVFLEKIFPFKHARMKIVLQTYQIISHSNMSLWSKAFCTTLVKYSSIQLTLWNVATYYHPFNGSCWVFSHFLLTICILWRMKFLARPTLCRFELQLLYNFMDVHFSMCSTNSIPLEN